MTNVESEWSLEDFERAAYARDYEEGARRLLDLLRRIDAAYGDLPKALRCELADGLVSSGTQEHVLTRIAAAITSLMSEPDFQLSSEGLDLVLIWHRWLSLIFSATPFVNADHILRSMNMHFGEGGRFEISEHQLGKFCALYGPDSNLPLDMDALHASPLPWYGLVSAPD